MLTVALIVLAAFFKAVSDTLAHHFSTSVFKWWDPRFWDASVSWQYASYLRFTKYKIDGWHLANSGQIIAFVAAIVVHEPVLHWALELVILGVIFNTSFSLFYNKILRK